LEATRLQRTSRPLVYQGPQHAFRAPDFLKQTPPRPRARSMPHQLQTSSPPRLHVCSRPPEVQSFMPLRRHICTLAARLHTSIPRHLYTYSMPPELFRQTLLRPYAGSAPLDLLLLLLLLHSHHLYRHIKQELDHGQERTGSGQELYRGQELGSEPTFHRNHFGPRCAGRSKGSTSKSPRLQACSTPPELQISLPLYLHISGPAACLPSSRSFGANTFTSPAPQHCS